MKTCFQQQAHHFDAFQCDYQQITQISNRRVNCNIVSLK